MKNYYYADANNIQHGPFDLEGLKKQPIRRSSLVWHSGLTQWTLACNLKELSEMFENTPPSLQETAAGYPEALLAGPQPKTWLLESILVMLCCFFPLGLVGLIFAAGVESKWRRGLYAEAIKDSREAERWTKIGFIVGLVIALISTLWIFVIPGGILAAMMSGIRPPFSPFF